MRQFLALVMALIFASCSGSSSQDAPTLSASSNQIFITKVIDGYISGANIFIDHNWNLVQDVNEPSAYEDTENNRYYFEKVFEDEKSKFLQCVALENLPPDDQIYTDCKISEVLVDSAYILSKTKRLDSCDVSENLTSEDQKKTNCMISRNPVPSELLDKFKKFESKRDITIVVERSLQF